MTPGPAWCSTESDDVLGHQERTGAGIHEELRVDRFGRDGSSGPVDVIGAAIREAVLLRAAGVVYDDVNRPEKLFGLLKESDRSVWFGEVRLDPQDS